jgi:hypothetical protein
MSVSNLIRSHALAELPLGHPSSTALFDERSVLQVNVQDAAIDVPFATTYHWSDHWTGTAADPRSGRRGDALRGCSARTTSSAAALEVPLGPRGAKIEISFTPQGHTDLAVRTRIVQGGRRSIISTWPFDAGWRWHLRGRHFFVASSMHHALLQVTLPAGHVRVCAAGSTRPSG